MTTYTDPDDLCTLSADMIQRDILIVTHQDSPIDLIEPAFNLTSVRTDSSTIFGDLKKLVVNLASNTIHDQLFSALSPDIPLSRRQCWIIFGRVI